MVLTAELATAQTGTIEYDGSLVNGTISLPQFDPALGTLTQIALAYHTLGEATWTFSNPATSDWIASVNILYNDNAGVSVSGPSINYRGGRVAGLYSIELPAFSSETMSNAYDVTIGGNISNLPGALDFYTGNGNVTFVQGDVGASYAVRMFVFGSASQINFDSSVDITSSSVAILYTYEVPEPSTFCIFCLSVLTLLRYLGKSQIRRG